MYNIKNFVLFGDSITEVSILYILIILPLLIEIK